MAGLHYNWLSLVIFLCVNISKGKKIDWSRIGSVIIRVINKIGRPRSGSPTCVNQEYDYRPNWTT